MGDVDSGIFVDPDRYDVDYLIALVLPAGALELEWGFEDFGADCGEDIREGFFRYRRESGDDIAGGTSGVEKDEVEYLLPRRREYRDLTHTMRTDAGVGVGYLYHSILSESSSIRVSLDRVDAT